MGNITACLSCCPSCCPSTSPAAHPGLVMPMLVVPLPWPSCVPLPCSVVPVVVPWSLSTLLSCHFVVLICNHPLLVVRLPSPPGWCCPCPVGVIPMLSSSLSRSLVCSVVFLVLVHVVVVLWWDRFSTNPFFSHKKNKKEKKKKRNLMMVARHTALPPPSLCVRGSSPAHVIRPCVPHHCLPLPLLRHCHRLCSVR